MMEVASNIGWAVIFAVIGGLVGMVLMMVAAVLIPKLLDRLTPGLDEDKELARGNRAVAEYFGRVVSACIIGMSVIIAAAILGGILAGLL
jgi:small-conductance mechanosensitive channel